jgi:ureidoacrylate peracid hydrolase
MKALETRPTPLEIDFHRAALVVIDMQNAFASQGGMLDLFGVDVSHVPGIVDSINRLADTARSAGAKVIWVATVTKSDGSDTPGPDTGFWCKDTATCMYRGHPEWGGNLTFRGTWGAALVDGLHVGEQDLVFEKIRNSAFYGTDFDDLLKGLDIKYLLFTGVATNICVQATIMDAFYRGYFPILIGDASANAGPPLTQQATEFNMIAVFGWLTSTEEVISAMNSE